MNVTKNSKNDHEVIAAVSKAVIDQLQLEESQELWPRYMDLATAAKYLDKSETCIRTWIHEGAIPTLELSSLQHRKKKPVFIDRYAVDQLLAVNN